MAELKSQLNDYVRSGIMHHLQGLQVTVRDYFPPKVEDFQCLRNPSLCAISARTRINNKTIKGINRHINRAEFEKLIIVFLLITFGLV
jgi:hypothetical protein